MDFQVLEIMYQKLTTGAMESELTISLANLAATLLFFAATCMYVYYSYKMRKVMHLEYILKTRAYLNSSPAGIISNSDSKLELDKTIVNIGPGMAVVESAALTFKVVGRQSQHASARSSIFPIYIKPFESITLQFEIPRSALEPINNSNLNVVGEFLTMGKIKVDYKGVGGETANLVESLNFPT